MKPTLWSRRRHRPVALLAAAAAAVGGLIAIAPQTATADTAPAAGSGLPTTVAANGLPTMQVNGIVWAQVTVGNTVYATGNFTKARPAGSAVGQNETPAGDIVAYDITTGKMITSFVHTMNNQGLSIAATPDGKTIYVGGDFTAIDGKTRNHIAAFDTATGALVSNFAPYIGGSVHAIVPTSSTVYVGGSFNTAGGQTRSNLAAFTPTSALTSWVPTADDGAIVSMVMAPDKSRVIVGGHFTTLNRVSANGMGAISATTGTTLPWAANQTIRDGAAHSSIDGLSTDGKLIYGAGYGYGTGNFEGRFAADPSTGQIIWANLCAGDSYATVPVGNVLYSTGHAHSCPMVGSFPDYFPANEPWHRALAESTFPVSKPYVPQGVAEWSPVSAAAVLDWFPSMTAAPATPPAGTVAVSGTSQAGWSLTANSAGTYIAVGGEMTAVNGTPQQALVRFAAPSVATDAAGNANNIQGPVSTAITQPTAAATGAIGSVAVTFGATWDRDNENLKYQLFRDGGTTPVATTTVASTFWQLPTGTLTDTTATAGVHSYVVKVSDPFGNSRSYPPVSAKVVIGVPLPGSVTSSLVYSVDGGKTWTTSPTVKAGANVLVRAYYNNSTGTTVANAATKTSLPTGFTRVPNTTQVCLNPGTTDPTHPSAEQVCNTSTGQGGAINESAVWSGSSLAISPTAGVYGQSSAATSGVLEFGKKANLNLANCAYGTGLGDEFNISINTLPASQSGFDAGATGASNTPATDAACGTSMGATDAMHSGVQSTNLLGQRFMNLANCEYGTGLGGQFNISINTLPASQSGFDAGATGASNTPATDPACGTSMGAPVAPHSGVQAIDLVGQRFMNLANCAYGDGFGGEFNISINTLPASQSGFDAGATGASNTPATDPACGTSMWATDALHSGVQTIDLLDQTRGQGFIQFTMKAPATAATVTQTATVTGAASAAKATIKVG